jgi:hypothetical protein
MREAAHKALVVFGQQWQRSPGDGLQHLELLVAYGGSPVPVTGRTVPL